MLSNFKTEQVGISTELAVAYEYGLPVDPGYVSRGVVGIANVMRPFVRAAMVEHKVPAPVAHIAAGQNPVDFALSAGKTLSVKSNMRAAGKVAPQVIGQPTAKTFWDKMSFLIPQGVDVSSLSYSESAKVFKEVALLRTAEMMDKYWDNLFSCDYILYASDVISRDGKISASPTVKVFEKAVRPAWKNEDFSFTQSASSWNESCTVKYRGVSIGEWQVHSNRDCFKFRFNIAGLIKAGLV